ncbi:MAG: c-type cytochrome [Granulicella sp.]
MHKPLIATSLTLALFCGIAATQLHAAPADPATATAKTAKTTKTAAKATSTDPAAIHAGQQVFLKNCFPCHSTNEGQQKVGPSLYHVNSGAHPRVPAATIRGYLLNGHSGPIGVMPSFKGILTEQDTDNLLAYVHSL